MGTRVRTLAGIQVVDVSEGIAGGYATKLFADAGADVVKVEPAGGDPMRRWPASGVGSSGDDGVVFKFLNGGKRSVVGSLDDAETLDLVAGADLVVESGPAGWIESYDLTHRFPHLVVLSISPFGHGGPARSDPWTEFTLQAGSGSIAQRGWPDGPPLAAGGRLMEWVSGAFAGPVALAAVLSARTGGGTHIDLSMLECSVLVTNLYTDAAMSFMGRPPLPQPGRIVDVPSIERTSDGFACFCVVSPEHYHDFCVLIERPEWAEDLELAQLPGRVARRDEFRSAVAQWCAERTTAEVVESASLFRIPAAPVCNGETVLRHEHLVERGVFVPFDEGRMTGPRPPYLLDGAAIEPHTRAPRLGEHAGRVDARPVPERKLSRSAHRLPLDGLKVVEFTTWWAGPFAAQYLAALGADVVHVESLQRLDGLRTFGAALFGDRDWWEWSPGFATVNVNKWDVTLDLEDAETRPVVERLIAWADLVIENFSPRVMEAFDLGWPTVQSINPRVVMVRMPSLGLDGPQRDSLGMAPTIESMSGMAWVTGFGDEPTNPRGPCDPLGGVHAAFAALVALEQARTTGRGVHVEVPLIEGALNVAAEPVLEASAHGVVLGPRGNRAVDAAPQGVYACEGVEQWFAVSVRTDDEWAAFRRVLGDPPWAADARFATLDGRQAYHDEIDDEIGRWASHQVVSEVVENLRAAGVPASAVIDHRALETNPQLAATGFFEEVEVPVVGKHRLMTMPFRMSGVERWTRQPAPTLGQHNRHVIVDVLGFGEELFEKLVASGSVGTRPHGW